MYQLSSPARSPRSTPGRWSTGSPPAAASTPPCKPTTAAAASCPPARPTTPPNAPAWPRPRSATGSAGRGPGGFPRPWIPRARSSLHSRAGVSAWLSKARFGQTVMDLTLLHLPLATPQVRALPRPAWLGRRRENG